MGCSLGNPCLSYLRKELAAHQIFGQLVYRVDQGSSSGELNSHFFQYVQVRIVASHKRIVVAVSILGESCSLVYFSKIVEW